MSPSPSAAELPLARTNAEARLFLRIQPCPECGATDAPFRSALVNLAGVLARRDTVDCPRCGHARQYQFRLPETILPPPVDAVQFGAEDPSQLLDPGQWLWFSDICARQVPENFAELDEAAQSEARHALASAVAALDEVRKFIPAPAETVPSDAFTSEQGQAEYRREPGRFRIQRLTAVRDYYADLLAQHS